MCTFVPKQFLILGFHSGTGPVVSWEVVALDSARFLVICIVIMFRISQVSKPTTVFRSDLSDALDIFHRDRSVISTL